MTVKEITDLTVLKQIVAEHRDDPGGLMPVLQKTQEEYGYLPFELQNAIAQEMGISISEVYGVATFYSQFTLTKKGEYLVSVCLGTACYVKNAQNVLDRLSQELGIKAGTTSEDGKFTLEATRCLGCCGLAPVIKINEEIYGGLVPDDIPGIIARY